MTFDKCRGDNPLNLTINHVKQIIKTIVTYEKLVFCPSNIYPASYNKEDINISEVYFVLLLI